MNRRSFLAALCASPALGLAGYTTPGWGDLFFDGTGSRDAEGLRYVTCVHYTYQDGTSEWVWETFEDPACTRRVL